MTNTTDASAQAQPSLIELAERNLARDLVRQAADVLAIGAPDEAAGLRDIADRLSADAQIEAIAGMLCPSCREYDDIIADHCEGPIWCPYACPHVEPDRAREIGARMVESP